MNERDFDHYFRANLPEEQSHFQFKESNWDDLAHLLQTAQTPKISWWQRHSLLLAAATVLLVSNGLWYAFWTNSQKEMRSEIENIKTLVKESKNTTLQNATVVGEDSNNKLQSTTIISSNQQSTSNQQLTISNNQQAASNKQVTTTISNNQQAASNKQVTTTISNNQQATSNNNQLATSSNQQAIINNKQVAISNKQITTISNNQQAASNNNQSTISNQQSTSNNNQPITSNQQSTTSNQQSTISNNNQSTTNNNQSTINQLPTLPLSALNVTGLKWSPTLILDEEDTRILRPAQKIQHKVLNDRFVIGVSRSWVGVVEDSLERYQEGLTRLSTSFRLSQHFELFASGAIGEKSIHGQGDHNHGHKPPDDTPQGTKIEKFEFEDYVGQGSIGLRYNLLSFKGFTPFVSTEYLYQFVKQKNAKFFAHTPAGEQVFPTKESDLKNLHANYAMVGAGLKYNLTPRWMLTGNANYEKDLNHIASARLDRYSLWLGVAYVIK
jgi:hypothetical protein